jgi:putative transposase
MGRPLRPHADGLLFHALNRGNNRQTVFHCPQDGRTFLRALAQTQRRYPFRLFGYCLMPNHFHLLLAPEKGQNISRILQSLTVAHTWHYHRQNLCTGHVWQGRFKSPVIEDDDHALTVLRYLEANPLRARLVGDLAEYPFCSYGHHGLGQEDPLLSPLPFWWERLGRSEEARQAFWRGFVQQPLSERELALLRKSVTSGRPYGSEAWVRTLHPSLGLSAEPRPRGRPRKQQPAP